MAANFWTSAHRKLLVPRERLQGSHKADLEKGLSDNQLTQLQAYLILYIGDLAKASQQLVRQRVAATACTYFHRFYVKNNFCEHDPRIIAPACLYLASKAEESQIQAKVLFQMMKKLSARYHFMPILEMKQLLDLEMVLLEELDFHLVVFSPYHSLVKFLADPKLAAMPATTTKTGTMTLAECCWAVLNDSYQTTICLTYAPHIIALACISVAAALLHRDVTAWMLGLQADLDQVFEVTLEITLFFDRYGQPISAEECRRPDLSQGCDARARGGLRMFALTL
ncbi:hypothetical protein WJX72_006148 [[Myrmecia] bisecta]|uniref:Cyclin-like domain-containing protein n=1 Tax=[Myrmecia] bisecta TaxID=41462 RepID=A0AAW1Q7B6_9CHLO